MAILAVRLETEETLMMNEFFDYNGCCWAISRSRAGRQKNCILLEDFYECTVQTEWVDGIPVVFVLKNSIAGWYRSARIYRNLQIVSAFLEGNICSRTLDARLLPPNERAVWGGMDFEDQIYQVIEEDDAYYEVLRAMIGSDRRRFVPVRFELAGSYYSADRVRLAGDRRDYCLKMCTETAERVMNDRCTDIRELKTMYQYAKQAVVFDKQSADGWYYLAMACEQLGFVREGLKAIDRALRIEADGDDLLALKGHLLFASGKYTAAAQLYEEACAVQPLDGYLMSLGQAWTAAGNMDQAYKAYQRVRDGQLLEDCGINLRDMERRWPFAALRGFSWKEIFGKKARNRNPGN